jgi:hypothetical protein
LCIIKYQINQKHNIVATEPILPKDSSNSTTQDEQPINNNNSKNISTKNNKKKEGSSKKRNYFTNHPLVENARRNATYQLHLNQENSIARIMKKGGKK